MIIHDDHWWFLIRIYVQTESSTSLFFGKGDPFESDMVEAEGHPRDWPYILERHRDYLFFST